MTDDNRPADLNEPPSQFSQDPRKAAHELLDKYCEGKQWTVPMLQYVKQFVVGSQIDNAIERNRFEAQVWWTAVANEIKTQQRLLEVIASKEG